MSTSLSLYLRRALNRAAQCHDGHYRKASSTPYLTHLVAVMHILTQHGASEELLAAALLHDVLEDRPHRYTAYQMGQEFGPRVVELVSAVTKDASLPTWRERAEAYLSRLRAGGDREAVLLCVADKMHNALSILDDYDEIGPAVWQRFNAGYDQQQWWYAQVEELATEVLGPHPLVAEYAAIRLRLEALAQ